MDLGSWDAAMIYYANPCTDEVRDAMSARRLGCIITPAQGNVTFADDGWDVIADNGAFSGRFDPSVWRTWLADQSRRIRFVVVPDVFDPTGGPCHEATVELWQRYGPMVERLGFRPAFVCQVGSTPHTLPDATVFFLGGTTTWKLGATASAITAEANRRGSWVHMGRVNSERRLTAARSMGCDSVDGTFLTFGPDKNLRRLLGWLDRADAQSMLTEVA